MPHPVVVMLTLAFTLASASAQTAPPADWDVAVIDACESATGFTPAAAEAPTVSRLTTTDMVKHQGRSVEWRFSVPEGADSLSLSHAADPLTNRGALSLWLKNPEGYPLELSIRLIGADGRAYESAPLPIGDQRGWRQVVYMTDDLHAADVSASRSADLEFPPPSLELVVGGAVPGTDYTLYLDDLLAHVAPPEELEVLDILAPETARPGQVVRASVRVRAPAALKRTYRFGLALISNGVALAEAELHFPAPSAEWAPGADVTTEVAQLTLPAFLAGGEYTLRLRAPGLALGGDAARGATLRVEGEVLEPLVAQVADHNGRPAVMVGEQPANLAGYLRVPGRVPDAALASAPLVIVPATATHDPYGWAPDVWLGPDEWDYQALDRSVIDALRASPETLVFLRVFLEAPDWWDERNPNETILFGHGRHPIVVPGVPGKQTYASFSSATWRADANEALRRFVAHVEAAPYARRVLGYQLAAGEDGRWRYWGAAEGVYPDYSRPQRTAFVAWLREKYGNDIRNLRAEWQQIINPILAPGGDEEPVPTVTAWEDIRIPDEEARTDHLSGALIDPAAAPEVADYNLFHAEQVAGFISELAAVAKETCESRKLVAVSYGHVLDHARSPEALQTAGHIALDEVFTDPNIDLIAAPTFRTESGPPVWSSLAASALAHGKVWIEETLPADAVSDPAEAIAARTLAAGGFPWLCPDVDADRLRPLLAANRALAAADRGSVAEIALLIDHYSLGYMAEGSALSAPLLAGQCESLAAVGAPFDVWLLDDLIADRMPEYRFYVVANAFYLDQDARDRIRQRLERDGKLVLWVYAPGAMDESLSGRTALDLTDLAIGFVSKPGPLRVKIVDPAHPLVDGVPKDFEYGPTEPIAPVFFALPTRGEAVGTIEVPSQLDKGEPSRWAGLIASESESWTTVFSAAPNVPVEVLRPLARRAGVHLYVDTPDLIWANASLLAIQARSAGEKRIRLPQPADVRDLLTGGAVATKASEFAVAMSESEARLFAVTAPQ